MNYSPEQATIQRESLQTEVVTVIDTPTGKLVLAATDRGLSRVSWSDEIRADGTAVLVAGPRATIARTAPMLAEAADQIERYFAGELREFTVPVDLSAVRGDFQRRVIEHIAEIPFGTTVGYAEIAAALGNPGATRAVGTACSVNPVPVVIPCHRVVRSDGAIGNFLGGTAIKQQLLDLESGDTEPARRVTTRPTRTVMPTYSADTPGSWMDPNDMADRQAYERSRRNDAFDRPPHY